MIATFGQTCGNPGLQSKTIPSAHIGGMAIARTTETEKEEKKLKNKEVLITIDAKLIEMLR